MTNRLIWLQRSDLIICDFDPWVANWESEGVVNCSANPGLLWWVVGTYCYVYLECKRRVVRVGQETYISVTSDRMCLYGLHSINLSNIIGL